MTDSAGTAAPVCVERVFETPIDVVWAALTRPEILAVWFREGAEAEARPGGVFRDREGDAGEFLEVDEPRRMTLTWKRAGGLQAQLSYELDDRAGATALRVTLSALPDDKERARQAEFWHWAVDSLESFLKTGVGIPYSPWRELQTELHRRAETKPAAEAEAERRAAGVVLAPLAPEPAVPASAEPKAKPAKAAVRPARAARVKPVKAAKAKPKKAAAKKTSAKRAAKKKPARRRK